MHGAARVLRRRGGQRVSIEFLHEYILGNYRRLYARTLAAGINHFSQATAIVAAARDRRDDGRARTAREEGALIAAALRALPPHRALRVLRALAERRVEQPPRARRHPRVPRGPAATRRSRP